MNSFLFLANAFHPIASKSRHTLVSQARQASYSRFCLCRFENHQKLSPSRQERSVFIPETQIDGREWNIGKSSASKSFEVEEVVVFHLDYCTLQINCYREKLGEGALKISWIPRIISNGCRLIRLCSILCWNECREEAKAQKPRLPHGGHIRADVACTT